LKLLIRRFRILRK